MASGIVSERKRSKCTVVGSVHDRVLFGGAG
jgi:hypothetical protein